jgi:hypothetical protein
LVAKERTETERFFILKVLARKEAETAHVRCEDGTSLKDRERLMANPDLELLRLEKPFA